MNHRASAHSHHMPPEHHALHPSPSPLSPHPHQTISPPPLTSHRSPPTPHSSPLTLPRAHPHPDFFHFNDNRVLPEHVTAEIANAEGWWYKPDFIINELNINSAIAYPGHLEVVPLQKKTYPVQGYAYNGGGRKVIRVEVSTDGGKTWTLSNLNHPEEPTEYGRYWCWCFWRLDVPIMELYSCERASAHAHAHAQAHAHAHAHTHAQTHAHIHACAHACIQARRLRSYAALGTRR